MKAKKLLFLLSFIMILFLWGSCSDESSSLVDETLETNNEGKLKIIFDNNFDWENSTKVKMRNLSGNVVDINVPWSWDSNMGVPTEWKDMYIAEPYAKRMYTKAKGWELVYCNVNEPTPYKYIVLYHKYTGLLRCFTYMFSNPGGAGTTESLWGINVNKATSLFNFTTDLAKAADYKPQNPTFMTTPRGNVTNSKFTSVGLQSAVWYGIEVELAYDPNIAQTNSFLFTLMGRGVQKIEYTGNITTTGNIEGTLKGTSPSSGVNVSFSDMFKNTSTNSISLSNKAAGDKLGGEIDTKKGNDPFFQSLWSNIQKNATKWISGGIGTGAQKGIEAILSQGGSVVGDALGGLLNSLTGGSKKESVSKLDLDVNLNSEITMGSEQVLVGWTDQQFPVAGSSTIPTFKPLYNEDLGVWNLKNTPQIIADLEMFISNKTPCQFSSEHYYLSYIDGIVLNPAIAKDFSVKNLRTEMVFYETQIGQNSNCESSRPVLVNMHKAYAMNGYSQYNNYSITSPSFKGKGKGKVLVSFDLVNKVTNEVQTSFSKYFEADIVTGYVSKHNGSCDMWWDGGPWQ